MRASSGRFCVLLKHWSPRQGAASTQPRGRGTSDLTTGIRARRQTGRGCRSRPGHSNSRICKFLLICDPRHGYRTASEGRPSMGDPPAAISNGGFHRASIIARNHAKLKRNDIRRCRLAGTSPVEPTGIEPVTSCLQSGRQEQHPEGVKPRNHWGFALFGVAERGSPDYRGLRGFARDFGQ